MHVCVRASNGKKKRKEKRTLCWCFFCSMVFRFQPEGTAIDSNFLLTFKGIFLKGAAKQQAVLVWLSIFLVSLVVVVVVGPWSAVNSGMSNPARVSTTPPPSISRPDLTAAAAAFEQTWLTNNAVKSVIQPLVTPSLRNEASCLPACLPGRASRVCGSARLGLEGARPAHQRPTAS